MLYLLLEEVSERCVFMNRGLELIQFGTEVDQKFYFCFLFPGIADEFFCTPEDLADALLDEIGRCPVDFFELLVDTRFYAFYIARFVG